MVSELKVYNRFNELTLHLRHSLDGKPELLIIDGTPEMQSAVAHWQGTDFDRTVAKGHDLIRLVANWDSAEYLIVLGRYLKMNFGWKTRIVQTQNCTAEHAATSGNIFGVGSVFGHTLSPQYPSGMSSAGWISASQSRSGGSTIVIANITEDGSEFQRPTQPLIVNAVPVPSPEASVYGISAA